MPQARFSTSDLQYHEVAFGVDTYPPVELGDNQVRLNMFYEEGRNRWPTRFHRLSTSEGEFTISGAFRRAGVQGGPKSEFPTFQLTKRGPFFSLPIQLPEPLGMTGVDENPIGDFQKVRSLFASAVPDVKFMRVGMVRKLLFATGKAPCFNLFTKKSERFNARLTGGSTKFLYRDGTCNINVHLDVVDVLKQTQLAIGATVTDSTGYGLQVILDVNNAELKPLSDDDIEMVLTRACGLWPDALLSFLNEGNEP